MKLAGMTTEAIWKKKKNFIFQQMYYIASHKQMVSHNEHSWTVTSGNSIQIANFDIIY